MWLLFAVVATIMNSIIAYFQYADGNCYWAMLSAASAGFGLCWIIDLLEG